MFHAIININSIVQHVIPINHEIMKIVNGSVKIIFRVKKIIGL